MLINNKIVFNLLFILSLIFFKLAQIVCLTQSLDFVYNSLPYKVFDVNQNNGSSQNIKIAKIANVAVIAVGKAGIMIIDNQFNQNIFKSPDESYTQCVQVTSNAKYIFSAMTNKVGVFEVFNYKELKLINTVELIDIVVTDMQFNLNENVIFILGQLGVLRWYDIRDKQNIKQIDKIIFDKMIFVKGLLSLDGKFFYVAADQDGLLVFKINNLNKPNQNESLLIKLERILRKQAISSFIDLVVTNKNEYIFAIDRWNGIYLLHKFTDLIIEGDDLEKKNFKIIKMEPAKLGSQGYTSTIELSSNSLYLFIGIRSQGILIYNIQDPINPQFFQQLQLTGQSVSLRLSPQLNPGGEDIFDNKYIYYSNSIEVIVYQKQQPVLQRNIPNLFNLQQSKLIKVGTAATKWRCKVSPNNKYLYGAFDADSLIVLKLSLADQSTPESVKLQLQYQFSDTKEILQRVDTLREFEPNESIPYGFYIDSIQFSKDGKYLYFPSSQYDYNVIAYKFEIIKSQNDEYSFKYVQGLKHTEVYYCEQFNISNDELHAIMSFDVGIVLVDMVEFKVLAQLNNVGVLGTCCGAVLSHDKMHALSVVRNVGVFIYDTSDMTNPKLANSWRTNGGETLYRSTLNNVIFLVDGFNGIKLLDSTKFPEFVVISKFITAGWSNFISLTLNENYGIISTMDTGMLTLIDIHDKQNPRLIMKSSIENFDSQTSCLDPTTLQYGFIGNKFGVRYFTMQSPVYIHVERQIRQIQTINFRIMDDNEPFEVGNSYTIRFVTLYRQQNQIITDIFYYKNLVLQDLPSWMQIDRENQTNGNLQTIINVDISKQCLESQNSKVSFLIIIIKTCFQLSETSFIFNTQSLETSKQDSLMIFKYLKSSGYINGVNCVTDFFDPTKQDILHLDDVFNDQIDKIKQTLIEEYVTETLKKSTAFNQFIFDVISSLKFNQDNQNQMVQAFQNYISISLLFPQQSPFIFVQKMYPNLIIYFNDEQTTMKMEGEIQYINLVLSSKILYFDLSQKDNYKQTETLNKTIHVKIVDNFNYDLQYLLKIPDEVQFFKEKSHIQLKKPLQEQLNKQYDGANFFIEVAFLITFDNLSFIDPDNIPLTYDLQCQVDGEFIPIPNDSFIKFDNNNLRLVGTPTSKQLFTVSKLRLVVKNGYTILEEDFSLKINKMPFSYVFNIILQVVGPIAFVFGLYQKRSVFMNIYLKNKTLYTTEIAYVNQMYKKKISIIGYDYELAHLFFYKFLKIIERQLQKKEQINQEYLQTTPYIYSDNKNVEDQIKLDVWQSSKINNDDVKSIYTQQVTKRQEEDTIQQTSEDIPYINTQRNQIKSLFDQNQENIMKQQQKKQVKFLNEQEILVEMSPKQKQEIPSMNQVFALKDDKFQKNTTLLQDIKFFHDRNINQERNQQIDENQQSQNQVQNQNNQVEEINYQKYTNAYQFIKNMVIKNDGQIELQQLFHLMLSYKLKISYNLYPYTIQSYKNEMFNQQSIFFFCLKACIIRYLIQYDERTLYLHRFLKRYSIKQGIYFENDWYKQYVSIIPTNDIDIYGVLVPFSKTVLKEENLFEIYQLLEFIPKSQLKENFQYLDIYQFKINPHLLREVLFADALGLDQKSNQNIIRCNGESLHSEKHKIISIEACKLLEEGNCMCLRRLFNLNYQTLPISKFNSLPSWMNYDFKNGVIILEGIPTKQDINHILIRIFDETYFATYQFHLKIEDKLIQFEQNDVLSEIEFYDENKSNQMSELPKQKLKQNISPPRQNLSIFRIAKLLLNRKKVKDPKHELQTMAIDKQENLESEQEEIINKETKDTQNKLDQQFQSLPLFSPSIQFQGDKITNVNIQNTNQNFNLSLISSEQKE